MIIENSTWLPIVNNFHYQSTYEINHCYYDYSCHLYLGARSVLIRVVVAERRPPVTVVLETVIHVYLSSLKRKLYIGVESFNAASVLCLKFIFHYMVTNDPYCDF